MVCFAFYEFSHLFLYFSSATLGVPKEHVHYTTPVMTPRHSAVTLVPEHRGSVDLIERSNTEVHDFQPSPVPGLMRSPEFDDLVSAVEQYDKVVHPSFSPTIVADGLSSEPETADETGPESLGPIDSMSSLSDNVFETDSSPAMSHKRLSREIFGNKLFHNAVDDLSASPPPRRSLPVSEDSLEAASDNQCDEENNLVPNVSVTSEDVTITDVECGTNSIPTARLLNAHS